MELKTATAAEPKKLSAWLEELPVKVWHQAIDNICKQQREDRLNWTFEGGITALQCAFDFRLSPEGNSYWMEIMRKTFKPVFS